MDSSASLARVRKAREARMRAWGCMVVGFLWVVVMVLVILMFVFWGLGLGFRGSSEYFRRAGLGRLYGTSWRTCYKILCESPSLLLL